MAELPADDPRHGTYNGYSNYKCRCADCREANRVTCRAYRVRNRERMSRIQKEYLERKAQRATSC